MTNKAGARRAQENLYVARQGAAASAFGQRQAALRQQAMLAKAREARAIAASKAEARAQAAREAKAAAAGPSVVVRRRLDVSAAKAFGAWTDAEALRTFYGAAGTALGLGELRAVAIDARVGGAFRFAWRRDGKLFEQRGTYLELSAPSRLAFTWDVALPAKEQISLAFAWRDGGCEVVLTHSLERGFEGDLLPISSAWEATLAALANALAK